MKQVKFRFIMLPAILLFIFTACKDQSRQSSPVFSLKEGNFWKYSGTYNEQKVNLRIKVLLVRKEGNLTFALMKGFFGDVMEGDDWEPSVWGMLAVGSEYYYRVSGSRIDSINKYLFNIEGVHAGLVSDADLLMTALSDTGQIFGETSQLTRADGNYFWHVTGREAFDPSSIKGLKIKSRFEKFTLNYNTISDGTTIDVVPGIGIVRYRYCHHGTPAELDLKLTEAGLQ